MSIKKLLADIRKADEMFGLFEDKDKIAVGLSGGKDSTLLLYCLNLYKRVAKNVFNKEFEVIGVHIDLNFGEEDMSPLYNFLENNNINYYSEHSQIADILKLNIQNNGIECSLCSKLKKGAVINAAKKIGCNKVAFGHHGDDAIETLFLNMIYGGRLATFDPIMYLESSGVTFIRPFVLSFESEIKKTGKDIDIPILKSGCPNDGHTKRQDIKELLHSIYREYHMSKKNFLLALYNDSKVNLFKGYKSH